MTVAIVLNICGKLISGCKLILFIRRQNELGWRDAAVDGPDAFSLQRPEIAVDRLALMTSFVRAVETGSFSAVPRELGTTQPNISRHIASLDAQVDSDPRRPTLSSCCTA